MTSPMGNIAYLPMQKIFVGAAVSIFFKKNNIFEIGKFENDLLRLCMQIIFRTTYVFLITNLLILDVLMLQDFLNACWNTWMLYWSIYLTKYYYTTKFNNIKYLTNIYVNTVYQWSWSEDQDHDLKITFWSDLRSLFSIYLDHDLDLILDHFFWWSWSKIKITFPDHFLTGFRGKLDIFLKNCFHF